jgi:transposase
MEACATAHYWGREIGRLGHRVKLLAPRYVKPFVRGSKTDRNDAQAICAAGLQPQMPVVAVKSEQQQALLAVHRLRALVGKQVVQLANQVRALLGEFGHVAPRGHAELRRLVAEQLERVPGVLQPGLRQALVRWAALQADWQGLTAELERLARADALCRRLMQEPGIGPLSATAYVATLGDPAHYRNGRQVSAALGLVPRQHSSGGQVRLLGIGKRGDSYLRTLLIHGARSRLRVVAHKDDSLSRWAQELIRRRGMNRAVVALANKNARRLWAIWRSEGLALAA